MSNIELFSCFWLDEHISQTKDHQTMQRELRKLINYLQIFNDSDECEQKIRNMTQEKIVLIASNSLANEILPRVHDLVQLTACYIFAPDQKTDKKRIDRYAKVNFERRKRLLIR